MKKKILFLTLFVLIILLCNNSYAMQNTDFNFTFLNDTSNYTIDELVECFNNYFCYEFYPYNYFTMYKGGTNNIRILVSYSPIATYYNTRYFFHLNFDSTDIFHLNNSYSYYSLFTFTENQSSPQLSKTSNTSTYNIFNFSNDSQYIMYSNYDIINTDDNSVYFAKNFDLQSSSEESEPIDMTEIIAPLEHIKAFLFLICMYLLCKVVYGVIWWLYNKILL